MDDLVLVAGGGAMGAGIAFVAAQGGYRAKSSSPTTAHAKRPARESHATPNARATSRLAGRIAFLTAIPGRSDACVAIEAVPERLELKREVLAKLAAALGPDALVATNTSSLSVSELAAAVDGPERVAGLHFFNPPEAMKLLESWMRSGRRTMRWRCAYAFAERIGKDARRGGRYPRVHRQSRGASVLSAGDARARTRRRPGRGTRRARALGRISDGTVRVDGFHRSRRQLGDQ